MVSRVALRLFVALGLTAIWSLSAAAQGVPDYAAIIAAPDRSAADRENDQRRDPVPLLAFTGARPGMKVLDMGAGAGYSTELMARAVAPGGNVYAQNAPALPESVRAKFDDRAKAPAMKNVALELRNFDDPLPPDVRDLDLITFLFFYHDTTYMEVDRAKMNRALFAALKPGGVLIIADHSARTGDGATVGKTLHRIEQSTLEGEVEAAGFKLVDEANFWRNPADPRDVPSFKPAVPVDEFVLKFQRPP